MTVALIATAWFDRFRPLLDDIESNEHWCARHWAPAPLLHADGICASMEMMQIFVHEIAPDARTVPALNARLHAVGRVCCTLGDERMHEIWQNWLAGS